MLLVGCHRGRVEQLLLVVNDIHIRDGGRRVGVHVVRVVVEADNGGASAGGGRVRMRDGRFVLDVAAGGSVSRDAGAEQTVYVLHWSPAGRFATRSRGWSPESHFCCRGPGKGIW